MADTVPDPLETAIGRVILQFNYLESQLKEILVALIGGDRGAAELIVYGNDRFEWLRQQLDVQATRRITDQRLMVDWSAFLAEVISLQSDRNRLAHDQWVLAGDKLLRVRRRVRRHKVELENEWLEGSYVNWMVFSASELIGKANRLRDRMSKSGVAFTLPG